MVACKVDLGCVVIGNFVFEFNDGVYLGGLYCEVDDLIDLGYCLVEGLHANVEKVGVGCHDFVGILLRFEGEEVGNV